MRIVKFYDQMSNKEKDRYISEWINRMEQKGDFNPYPELNIAKEYFKNRDLNKASQILSRLTDRYLNEIAFSFKEYIENLSIDKYPDLEKEIKFLYRDKKIRQLMKLIDKSIEECKLGLTEKEERLIKRYGLEFT